MINAARLFATRVLFAIVAVLALFPLLFADCACAAQQRLKIAATSQILCEITAFICGGRAEVRSLSVFDEEGKARLVARPSRREIIVAFDAADAARHRISEKNANLQLLFDRVQISEADLRAAFFDPAMLPFIAQEVMKTVSKIDPDGYAYYQRRLAEFQSRIDSAIGVGRHMLLDSGAKILDLTGAEGAWIRSSIIGVVRPPISVWNGWLAGDEAALKSALDEAARRGWLVLLDPWTPEILREATSGYPNSMTLPSPSGGDIFIFFHEMLTAIAARLGEK